MLLFLACTPIWSTAQNASNLDLEAHFSAMIVTNIDTSINWYTDVLGFEVLNLVVSKERGFRQSNLKKDAIAIELIELDSAISIKDVAPNYTSKTRVKGFFKTGFLVSDFDKWMSHLNKKEVNFHGSVVTDESNGKRMVIIKDPDGNRIQIFEK